MGTDAPQHRIISHYEVTHPDIPSALKLAVVSDLHNGPYEDVLPLLRLCDGVLVLGDLVDRHSGRSDMAERFLREVPELLPVFYALGNHEVKFPEKEAWLEKVRKSRAMILDNEATKFQGIYLGGLSSAEYGQEDIAFLERFERLDGFRLLLCHHPEVYARLVRPRQLPLTLCGHAHGGQIQIFGRGLYAPGQGFLPKLISGPYDGGRMILSRGMTNAVRVPRWGNPCELVILELKPGNEKRKEETEK